MPIAITNPAATKPIHANGSTFPTSSTPGRIGVTSSCSIVPSSRSRAMLIAVTTVVTIRSTTAATPGTMYTGDFIDGLYSTR